MSGSNTYSRWREIGTPFVVSVSTILLYATWANSRLWPFGHVNCGAASGPAVIDARTRPFFGSIEAPSDTWPSKDCLLAALGFLPPRLIQA
jgi:hypothetical protein